VVVESVRVAVDLTRAIHVLTAVDHTKPRKRIARRYFGRFHQFRNDRWVFGDPDHHVGDQRDTIAHLSERRALRDLPDIESRSRTNVKRTLPVTGSGSVTNPNSRRAQVTRAHM
jgi:hypothetical protein